MKFNIDNRKSGPDGKPIPHQQSQQSHLMDLLDISLGAASICGPSQSTDPWGMPVAGESSKQVRFILDSIIEF